MHYDLLPHVEVLHCVEQVILWSRLVDAVTTNQSTYINVYKHAAMLSNLQVGSSMRET